MAHATSYKVQIDEHELEISLNDEGVHIAGSSDSDTSTPVRVNRISDYIYSVILDNRPYRLLIDSITPQSCTLSVNGVLHEISVKDERQQLLEAYGVSSDQQSVEREIKAPMPGLVLDLLVSEGDEVEAGNGLLVLEAMKMENEIKASSACTIAKIHVKSGDPVAKGDLLLELDPAGDA